MPSGILESATELLASFTSVIAASATLAVVTESLFIEEATIALSAIFTEETAASAIFAVLTAASAIFAVDTPPFEIRMESPCFSSPQDAVTFPRPVNLWNEIESEPREGAVSLIQTNP